MKSIKIGKNQAIFTTLGSLLLATSSAYATDGLIEELKRFNISAGAWANGGITYNATDPEDNFNGPVTFGDRSGEFQLNQLNLFIQKAVATEGKNFDVGARFDVMFGTDAAFTQAYGAYTGNNAGWDLDLLRDKSGSPDSNRFYGLAVPQAYLEMYVPVGNGLNVKVGHFYTPIGYEVVTAPDNFFYTHAYTMQYGEPFTHTGILGNYAVNSSLSLMGGVVTGSETGGWDGNFDAQLGNWAGIMGATYTLPNGTSLNVSGTYGAQSETNNADWSMYSIVLKHNFNAKTHFVLQHDHGFADNVATFTAIEDAEWYGVNSHLYYDVKDDLSVGIRAEWFRDQNGFRVYAPGRPFQGGALPPASYYELTAGVTWKPKTWLTVRPNVRYDWVEDTSGTTGSLPFDAGNKDNQFTFSTDVTVKF